MYKFLVVVSERIGTVGINLFLSLYILTRVNPGDFATVAMFTVALALIEIAVGSSLGQYIWHNQNSKSVSNALTLVVVFLLILIVLELLVYRSFGSPELFKVFLIFWISCACSLVNSIVRNNLIRLNHQKAVNSSSFFGALGVALVILSTTINNLDLLLLQLVLGYAFQTVILFFYALYFGCRISLNWKLKTGDIVGVGSYVARNSQPGLIDLSLTNIFYAIAGQSLNSAVIGSFYRAQAYVRTLVSLSEQYLNRYEFPRWFNNGGIVSIQRKLQLELICVIVYLCSWGGLFILIESLLSFGILDGEWIAMKWYLLYLFPLGVGIIQEAFANGEHRSKKEFSTLSKKIGFTRFSGYAILMFSYLPIEIRLILFSYVPILVFTNGLKEKLYRILIIAIFQTIIWRSIF